MKFLLSKEEFEAGVRLMTPELKSLVFPIPPFDQWKEKANVHSDGKEVAYWYVKDKVKVSVYFVERWESIYFTVHYSGVIIFQVTYKTNHLTGDLDISLSRRDDQRINQITAQNNLGKELGGLLDL